MLSSIKQFYSTKNGYQFFLVKLTMGFIYKELSYQFVTYRKVASTSLSYLEAHARFFRLSMKGKFDVYLL
jgi:hypothetical protein